MNDFAFSPEINSDKSRRPLIPESAYRPVKRCPTCKSVYLNDTKCEACGRSLSYHPIGEAFSAKSLYGLKERFYQTLPYLVRLFPLFENKSHIHVHSYKRNLNRRLLTLLSALADETVNLGSDRRFFYIEVMELIDELLRYGESPLIIKMNIEDQLGFTAPLITVELLKYLESSKTQFNNSSALSSVCLNHRLWGIIRVELFLKIFIISATAVTMACYYFDVIRWQVGK